MLSNPTEKGRSSFHILFFTFKYVMFSPLLLSELNLIPLMSVSFLFIKAVSFVTEYKLPKVTELSIFAEDTLPLNVRAYDQPHITIYTEIYPYLLE